jgi:hypothetical protein
VIHETRTDINKRRHNLIALNDKVSLLRKRILLERYRRLRVLSGSFYRRLDGAKDSLGLSGGGALDAHRSVKFTYAGASMREQLEAQWSLWRRRSAKRWAQ